MKTLITPAEVIRTAFAAEEYPAPSTVREADIAAAERRHIVPVIGEALYERTLAGACEELRLVYLAAPLALHVRADLQPRLDIRTRRAGTAAPYSDDARPASATAVARLVASLRREARTLLRRASDFLEAHRDDYPDYDPSRNILNRCSTDGGIVQIR